jgi:hypothetical protein
MPPAPCSHPNCPLRVSLAGGPAGSKGPVRPTAQKPTGTQPSPSEGSLSDESGHRACEPPIVNGADGTPRFGPNIPHGTNRAEMHGSADSLFGETNSPWWAGYGSELLVQTDASISLPPSWGRSSTALHFRGAWRHALVLYSYHFCLDSSLPDRRSGKR